VSRWADRLMSSLDERAFMIETALGPIQVAREGAGPSVLSIHGSPGGFDQALIWARHLRNGGCQLVAPSRPGYLRTPLDSGRKPSEQADLYASMLDALHIDKVTILGISSGGPSAVHFAARHPNRTKALLLDAAVLLPISPASSAIERAVFESGVGVWLSCQVARRWPRLTTASVVDALSAGLSRDRKRDAVEWITSSPARLDCVVELPTSLAPRRFREPGQRNDESNEINLDPLPFAKVTVPTLVAQGENDAFPLIDHATSAACKISDAELMLVEEGHHGLPWCRQIDVVARRQLELALS